MNQIEYDFIITAAFIAEPENNAWKQTHLILCNQGATKLRMKQQAVERYNKYNLDEKYIIGFGLGFV